VPPGGPLKRLEAKRFPRFMGLRSDKADKACRAKLIAKPM